MIDSVVYQSVDQFQVKDESWRGRIGAKNESRNATLCVLPVIFKIKIVD